MAIEREDSIEAAASAATALLAQTTAGPAPEVTPGPANEIPLVNLRQVWYRDWADALSALCFVVLNGVMLSTMKQYGFTYDEPPHIRYGERIIRFYSSGFTERGGLNSSYVGGFDLAAALLRRVSPFDAFETNHWLALFVSQVGLLGAWKLGRLLGGQLGGLLSLLFLVLTPVYYGHQFNNPKDIPFAVGYIWGLYFIAQLLKVNEVASPALLIPRGFRLARWSNAGYWSKLALALGLGMSVRVGGALLIGYLALFVLLLGSERWRLGCLPGARALRDLGGALCLAVGSAWCIMLVFWPQALQAPLDGPASALKTVSNYAVFDSPTLFKGEMLHSHHVPWDYLPTYFAFQLPEFTLACFFLGCGACLAQSIRRYRLRQPLEFSFALLLVAVFLPPSYAIYRHSTLYDGLRHFLFLIPPICVVAGVTVSRAASALSLSSDSGTTPPSLISRVRGPRAQAVLALVVALFAVDQASAEIRLHPHQHVFFNRLAGGLRSAVKRYETEYYGSLYREMHTELSQLLWKEQRDSYLNSTIKITGCGSNLFFSRNLPPNFAFVSMGKAKDADIFATYPRDRCLEKMKQFPRLFDVRRDGAVLGVVRDLSGKLGRVNPKVDVMP